MCRESGLEIAGIVGMTYNPLTQRYALGKDTDVNYIMHCRMPS
jgi:2-polyprenyl-6-hydroxyphenyl methylase/3-demethylubiquinone-9 3-methyltransferase